MDDARHAARSGDEVDERVRVLIVEDDRALGGYLAERLEMAGFRAIQSRDGLDGWRAFEAERPHVLVVDLDMPVMSGSRLLRLLRPVGGPAPPRVPVIVMTGYDLQEALDVVRDARPDAYLQKPFPAERLLERVRDLLARRDR